MILREVLNNTIAVTNIAQPTENSTSTGKNTGIQVRIEGKGPTIIWLSDTVCPEEYSTFISQRLTRTHQVVRVYFPAPANDEEVASMVQRYLDFLNKLTDQLKLSKFMLWGSSFGGQMAYQFASLYPQRVSKMMLIAPTGYSSLFEGTRCQALSLLYYKWLPLEQTVSHRNKRSMPHEKENKTVATPLKIKELNTPTLLLWGEKDPIVPISDARKFRSFMTDIHFVSYPNTGHLIAEERPKEVLQNILEFIQ
jgi:pimeloyl-ACP methyl ester carboxylesterase